MFNDVGFTKITLIHFIQKVKDLRTHLLGIPKTVYFITRANYFWDGNNKICIIIIHVVSILGTLQYYMDFNSKWQASWLKPDWRSTT